MDEQHILIVDDEKINREILKEMFQEYGRLEAADGREAVLQLEWHHHHIVLVLLDIAMPVMSGFGVLEYMQEHGLLETIPVILITGETIIGIEDKAYSYGTADVIHKPFYPHIVKKRSRNIIELYQNKHNMEMRLKEREQAIRAQEKEIREDNEFMVDAFSSVVETRSVKNGEHTKHIKYFTRIILRYLMKHFPKYGLTDAQADQIVRASALHDIGKAGIPDAILLKPGRLTPEEYEIMKTHTTIGCDILEKTYPNKDTEFYRYSYDICRHHHERWDGSGYPDRLKGNEIPIYAQAVAIADAYDALISPRVYKQAITNQIAFDMIRNGKCGLFGPDILECFQLAKEEFFSIVEVEVVKMFKFERH